MKILGSFWNNGHLVMRNIDYYYGKYCVKYSMCFCWQFIMKLCLWSFSNSVKYCLKSVEYWNWDQQYCVILFSSLKLQHFSLTVDLCGTVQHFSLTVDLKIGCSRRASSGVAPDLGVRGATYVQFWPLTITNCLKYRPLCGGITLVSDSYYGEGR